jgi:hypothetical protein
MGTIFEDGKKPRNRITISKSGETIAKVDPETGATDRSFAQPNPAVPQREVEPKAHAGAQDEVEALNENSTKGRTYSPEEDEDCVEDTK